MGKVKNTLHSVKKGIRLGVNAGVKTAKVGVAAARLVGKVTNPYNMTKMTVNAARGKGLVLPGSRYIGPGNSLDSGTPTSSADRAAKLHDIDYNNLLKSGVKPSKLYAGFSKADQRLMNRSDITTPDGLATYSGMLAKKGLYKLGLTGKKIDDPKTKYVKYSVKQ